MKSSGGSSYVTKYYYNGVYSSQKTGTKLLTVGAEDVKVSVDEGGFVPGIYRVNPYFVSSSRYVNESSTCETPFYQPQPTGWGYTTKQVGNNFLQALVGLRLKVPTVLHPDVGAIALQKAYAKVNQAQLPLGEDLGELGVTLKMLRNPLQGLRDFLSRNNFRNAKILHYLKSGNRKAAERVPQWISRDGKNVADTWLELRYGLRPLVMTLASAIEMYAKQEAKIFDRRTIRSVRSKKTSTTAGSLATYEYTFGELKFTVDGAYSEEKTAYASVQYRQYMPQTALAKFGLSPEFLPETAWQLTKLSFVVDWIFDVSTFLSALRLNPQVEFLGNTVGIKRTRIVRVKSAKCKYYLLSPPWTSTECDAQYEEHVYDRNVNVSMYTLPIFQWSTKLTFARTADALALIAQSLLRTKR